MLLVVIATRACAIFSDVVAIVMTWWTVFSWWRRVAVTRNDSSLWNVLLMDGGLIMATLLCAVYWRLRSSVSISVRQSNLFSSSICDLMSLARFIGILISRFMFNLRQCRCDRHNSTISGLPSFVAMHADITTDSHDVIIPVSTVIGNIGSPLHDQCSCMESEIPVSDGNEELD
ncbi:hypothetical protein WOLCODRAFT_107978 [Wolfiporia cocos MD-104 SS10]|uniref:Uncharacterized protein n=1 Tax=Wolfiporia cocos (strain MD-104) TaxID=742152 RepID=A0A2H3J191_WOLCO|nr:hypothetical protein WOLCODRAFT_107978 [Wolfiporia cocos MD-104 SS10]